MKRNLETWELIDRVQRAGRKLPVDTGAETALIGAMLWAGNSEFTSRAIAQSVYGEDSMFSSEIHTQIAQAIGRLLDKGDPIDRVSISTEAKHLAPTVVSEVLSTALKLATDSMKSGEYYLKAVHEAYKRRTLAFAIERSSAMLLDPELDLADAREELEQALFEVAEDKTHGYKRLSATLPQIIEDLNKPRLKLRGVLTGITGLDAYTNGWQKGDLILVAAESSDGKSSLGLHLALQAAGATGVALTSCEMRDVAIARRIIANRTGINSFEIKTGNLLEHEKEQIRRAADELRAYELYIDSEAGVTPPEIKGRLRKLMSKTTVGLVIVDYFQLLRSAIKHGSREQDLSSVSRELKAIAMSCEVPLVLLAQLNKDFMGRKDKRKLLSDIRESAGAEKDCDVGIIINWDLPREERNTEKVIRGVLDLIKQREGPTGEIPVEFDRTTSTFRDAPVALQPAIDRARDWTTTKYEPQPAF